MAWRLIRIVLHFITIKRLITSYCHIACQPIYWTWIMFWMLRNYDLTIRRFPIKMLKTGAKKKKKKAEWIHMLFLLLVLPQINANHDLWFTVDTKHPPSIGCSRVTRIIENTKTKLAMSSCIPNGFPAHGSSDFTEEAKSTDLVLESIYSCTLMKRRYCNKACIFPNFIDFMY